MRTDITKLIQPTRDLRVDFFRGLALFCIFVDHIPGSWMSTFTIRFTGLYDAAEIFIFISGYTAGLVYGRVMETSGRLMMSLRVFHRVWQLYVTHVFLFVLFMALIGNMTDAINNPIYAEEFRAMDFLKEPGTAIMMALTLQFQPDFMDILPLYIVLLTLLPFFLMGLRKFQWVVLTLSFSLWLAVQFNSNIALPTYPDPETKWFFNPFAWQFLFLFGAALGRYKAVGGDAKLSNKWLFWSACVVSLTGFMVQFFWTLELYDPNASIFAEYAVLALNKTQLSPPRLLNVLATILVVSTLLTPDAKILRYRASWPLMVCGRHSLYIFCCGILLSAIGHWIIAELYGEFWLQTLVLISGISIMIMVAAFIDWYSKSQSDRSKVKSDVLMTMGSQ